MVGKLDPRKAFLSISLFYIRTDGFDLNQHIVDSQSKMKVISNSILRLPDNLDSSRSVSMDSQSNLIQCKEEKKRNYLGIKKLVRK